MELSRNGVIEVDVESHELLRVNEEEVSGIEHKKVLDLSDDGERWEGDVLNNQPYGWGVVYDSEGEKKYEGFMIGEVNVCYGTQYYSDIQKVEYEGEWCEGKRWGRGVQFDRAGNKVYDGEWMNDEQPSKRVVLTEENQLLHNRVEELIVNNDCCNGREWSVEEVKLIGLNQLERVVIGGADPDHHFYLKNCEKLRELKIGYYSFYDYSVCEIENLPSLEVIEMGEWDDASLELKSDSEGMN
ncbi:hypothetical protein AV274_1831 [Blastocystis sp. ATCC 50177/Nand II]|uniref:MORN repeat-containing protein n=1 Tax=Blastocystis sp. subtype 1 (strain ATCC 50177 / NandII) TaxID=478820 RepID=A0A196SHE9_BLAHN|nr:hypothetical protein AV274_1831 [Blastocystis sp. ATCC 50177/Nand II]